MMNAPISIYVGNLPLSVSEDEVRQMFVPFGDVAKVSLIQDRETGQPRGFGFVEMTGAEAMAAIDALDGSEFQDRILRVNESRDKGAKPPRRQW